MLESAPIATITLIHGAWASSWVWAELTLRLQTLGYRVIVPELPGSSGKIGQPERASLTRCVEEVLDQLQGVEGPLFIVGHSGGGVVATQVAQVIAERISGVVFVAGMMLPSGMGFAEIVEIAKERDPAATGISPYLQWSRDGQVSHVPPSAASAIFFNDMEPDRAQAAGQCLGPQAEGSRALVPKWTDGRFGSLPRLYIEARLDRSVTLSVQRLMQSLTPAAHIVSLEAGHVPQVSRPDDVAAAIADFVNKYSN
ncbi:alpha/beta fold hydrolase [Hydrocarboniclastica marina]|uniref:Alpha/beta hydrolase n=1 Tax=Hydrocarboniclastica marina TaxID=2259620 RepID=A0A4P7XJT8_9ALTE|nr:alpha/beta hydrolase [Hydrocarboniclastica marina]MAM00130.1 alkyl salicylate esterase [Alteromonadaceae bacterium]QCF27439.1 alpha/beta hydrolase [Hydrocarboniclastica marina]|tara:strand:+ start:172 stop:936 length:765 start_codon:yes stop_codon:yes gene_type:complete